jgi:hypothetical protein
MYADDVMGGAEQIGRHLNKSLADEYEFKLAPVHFSKLELAVSYPYSF